MNTCFPCHNQAKLATLSSPVTHLDIENYSRDSYQEFMLNLRHGGFRHLRGRCDCIRNGSQAFLSGMIGRQC
jgi:hypothetical protein